MKHLMDGIKRVAELKATKPVLMWCPRCRQSYFDPSHKSYVCIDGSLHPSQNAR